MPPSVRYAQTADGASIAFASLGEGPPLLCMPPFPFSHVEAGWRLAGIRQWFERLARGRQVATYDARGTGLSDRARPEFGIEAMIADLDAVASRLGWDRFALAAMFNATPVAVAYAAEHPERVTELVLWGPFTRGTDVYPMPIPEEAGELVGVYWPMLVDTAARTWTAEAGAQASEVTAYFQACVAPEAALRAIAAARRYDVGALVERVTTRALVLQRADAASQRPDLARSLASRLPDAELVMLEGEAASPFAGDVDAGVQAIERFLGVDTAAALRPADGVSEALTPREREILALLARGRANKQIAGELGVSIHTVERHLTNLYAKLGCQSRTEAVAFALTHGYR